MPDGRSSFSHSIPFLYGDSVGGYIKRFFLPIGKYFKEKLVILYLQHTFFLAPKMLICPSDIFSSTFMLLGQSFTLKRCFLLAYQLCC